ncbi:hypothetical protein PJP10_15210 [Mycobacterium kansasii]
MATLRNGTSVIVAARWPVRENRRPALSRTSTLRTALPQASERRAVRSLGALGAVSARPGGRPYQPRRGGAEPTNWSDAATSRLR